MHCSVDMVDMVMNNRQYLKTAKRLM